MSFNLNINRSLRIVYVGNIPLEVAEGNLKELLSEYGAILNIRLFRKDAYQYAFCEYGEQEIATRAVHCLSNYTIKGQTLRVNIAAAEKNTEELASLQEFLQEEMAEQLPSAMDVTEKAPEEISKAVASLPAEQMFELMKQMKMCIENNPQEARNLLLQNPQLAYALLQAQVIMRIVDPEVALKILDRPSSATSEPETKSVEMKQPLPAEATPAAFLSAATDKDMRQLPSTDYDMRSLPPTTGDNDMRPISGDLDMRSLGAGGTSDARPFDPRFRPADPRAVQSSDPRSMPGADPRSMPGADPRSMQGADPRAMQGADPRAMQGADPRVMQNADPRSMQVPDSRTMQNVDPRAMQVPDPRTMQGIDPRAMQNSDLRTMQSLDPRAMLIDPRANKAVDPRSLLGGDPRVMQAADPRSLAGNDPRGIDPRGMHVGGPRMMPGVDMGSHGQPGPAFGPRSASNIDSRGGYDPRSIARGEDPRKPPAGASIHANLRNSAIASSESGIPEDEEKAALIMQVLQLSEEQIAMLPPEQRQSIMVLKEQIARSQLTM